MAIRDLQISSWLIPLFLPEISHRLAEVYTILHLIFFIIKLNTTFNHLLEVSNVCMYIFLLGWTINLYSALFNCILINNSRCKITYGSPLKKIKLPTCDKINVESMFFMIKHQNTKECSNASLISSFILF